jgi:hypothetical protein
MHHAHVKRKEKPMNRYVMEEFYRLPDLRERLERAAHRERARALYAGFNWLLAQLKARLTPRLRPARSLARLG